MIVHLVYSVPPAQDIWTRGLRRFGKALQKVGVEGGYFWPRQPRDTAEWPSRAPYTITRFVYEALSREFETRLYHLAERIAITGGANDILIGHPMSADTVWLRSLLHGRFGAHIAMLPIHYGMPEYLLPVEPYVPKIDSILGITGHYWIDTWTRGPLAHWAPKIVHLDMALDATKFPRVKTRFNPPGKRKFFFIGNAAPYKGVHLLSVLFGLAAEQSCIWISAEPGFPNLKLRPATEFTSEYVKRLANEVDFFITLGVSDANPTTILEAMAWGFPVLCTPQSGYQIPEVISMSTNDMNSNVAALRRLQAAPEKELFKLADAARELVVRHFTWSRFQATVIGEVKRIASLKGIS